MAADPDNQVPRRRHKGKLYGRRTGRQIPPALVAAVKAELDTGKALRRIARENSMSVDTVKAIKYTDRYDIDLVEQTKKGLAGGLYITADRALASITDKKLEQATANQAAVVAGITIEKARLVEGLATNRVEMLAGADIEIQQEIDRLEAELAAYRSGRLQNADVTAADQADND